MCVVLLGATRQFVAWPQGLPGVEAVWLDSLWLQGTADTQGGAALPPPAPPSRVRSAVACAWCKQRCVRPTRTLRMQRARRGRCTSP